MDREKAQIAYKSLELDLLVIFKSNLTGLLTSVNKFGIFFTDLEQNSTLFSKNMSAN